LKGDLLKNPEVGDIIKETSGLRKIRIPIDGKGKRGGARVIYYYLIKNETIYLLFLYKKNTQEDISQETRDLFIEMVSILKNGVKNNGQE